MTDRKQTKPSEPERFFLECDAMTRSNGNDEDDWVRYEDAKKWAFDSYHLGVDHGHKEAAPSGLVFQPDGRIEQLATKQQTTSERLRGARCDECVHCHADDDDHDNEDICCQINPPMARPGEQSVFPIVLGHWVCGRFERREVAHAKD